MTSIHAISDLLCAPASVTDRKSFRLLWESARLALLHHVPVESVLSDLDDDYDEITTLWGRFPDFPRPLAHQATLSFAWTRLGQSGDATLTGRLRLGEGGHYHISLDPAWLDGDGVCSRFARKFGSHRFLTLYIDQPRGTQWARILKDLHGWLHGEHVIAGRRWKLVYFRKRSTRSSNSAQSWEAKLFAVAGRALLSSRLEEYDVRQVIDWLIPLEHNRSSTACKIYSRLSLGFSRGQATCAFRPDQMHRVPDLIAPGPPHHLAPVMSDSCARISREAALSIWHAINGEAEVPSVLQGRIANAKGLWVVSRDATKDAIDEIWIEIAASQEKYKIHAEDEDEVTCDPVRMTFHLLEWCRPPVASHLSASLIPILHHGHVSFEALASLVESRFQEERDFLERNQNEPVALARWLSDKMPHGEHDVAKASVTGCMPNERWNRLAWMVQSGFEPQRSGYLSKLILDGIRDWCERVQTNFEIEMPSSTSVFAVPDFEDVLDENEVHLTFSQNSPDGGSPFLFDQDVLIGRYPMHRPSDVQKVRAVYRKELAHIQNVIVFPSRGTQALADMMSNGDYDGDRYWVCWDPRIVLAFVKSSPPRTRSPTDLGIRVDTTTVDDLLEVGFDAFLRHNLEAVTDDSVLGMCASYQEKYSYEQNSIDTPSMAILADLRDHLVDAPKQGFRFSLGGFFSFLKKNGFPEGSQKKLLYKMPTSKLTDSELRGPHAHVLDKIRFEVLHPACKGFVARAEELFSTHFRRLPSLAHPFTERERSMSDLDALDTLSELKEDLESLVDFWQDACHKARGSLSSYSQNLDSAFVRYNSIEPRQQSHLFISEWMKQEAPSMPSTWRIIKASALYHLVAEAHRKDGRTQLSEHFLYSLAATELFFLNAFASKEPATPVVPGVLKRMRFKSEPLAKGAQVLTPPTSSLTSPTSSFSSSISSFTSPTSSSSSPTSSFSRQRASTPVRSVDSPRRTPLPMRSRDS